MKTLTRRHFMAFAAGGTVALAAGQAMAHDNGVKTFPAGSGGRDPGPHDPIREAESPDILNPPLPTAERCQTFAFLSVMRTYAREAVAGRVR